MIASTRESYHEPVMVSEVLQALAVRPGGRYIDCTVGDGGHASAILEASSPNGTLLGLDVDPESIKVVESRLNCYGQLVSLVRSNYKNLASVAASAGFSQADGVLFDLGISSRQLDLENRGFSIRSPNALDMRFDPTQRLTAEDLVNHSDQETLADLIFALGEEPRARRIARAIVAHRPVPSSKDLAEIISKAAGYKRSRIHPATRTFQAIRIYVNQELETLSEGLAQAVDVLRQGGRLVTIAYHSLEDRIVKEFIRGKGPGQLKAKVLPVKRKVVKPTAEEIRINRRCRSARLRVAEAIQ